MKQIKCEGCKEKLVVGDQYKIGMHFDEIVCEDCWGDYEQELIDNKCWLDLNIWEDKKIIEVKKPSARQRLKK